MSIVKAEYYDGKTSERHEVSLVFAGKTLKIIGAAVNVQADLRRVRRSLRIATTPRWLYLPDGGACVTDDNDAIDRVTRKRRYDRILQYWEGRPALGALAVAIVAACTWTLVTQLVPRVADEVASHIPVEAETVLGAQTLQGMDRIVFQRSELSAERQVQLGQKFVSMMRAAEDNTPYRLEFRVSPALGANAFALPAGIIVVLDDLVRLARTDDEVLGVLAHEAGHVHHRHTLRRLLEGSATALLIAGLTGDMASTTSLAAAAPALLLQTKYSRDNEREADAYGVEVMKKAGVDSQALAVMLGRLENLARQRRVPGMPTFLSSHPTTEERRAAILAATGTTVEALEDAQRQEVKERQSDLARHGAPFASQQEILAVLAKGDVDELDRMLTAYQRRYESDPASEQALYTAFRAFRSAPLGTESTLRQWAGKKPDSYSASLALGIFYLWHGIQARGEAFVADTPRANFEAMATLVTKARPELERSVDLAKKPFLSHLSLITLSRYAGDRDLAERQYLLAKQFASQSVRLRLARMTTLEPKWGGSYDEMEAFARESTTELSDANAVKKLAARVPAARADGMRARAEFIKAQQLYSEALRLDPSANELRCARAWALTQYGRHAEAYQQAREGFDLDHASSECARAGLWSARQMGDRKKVAELATLAIEGDSNWAYPYTQRGWAREQDGQREAAFQDYLAAAKLGDPWAEMRAGHGYFMGWGAQVDHDEGITWLRKAVADGNTEARGMLQKALQMTGKQ